jgi:hypothetical protein
MLIDNAIHAFEIFRTPNIVLKDTHVMEGLDLHPIPLVEPVDTIGEQPVDDLVVGVKHVIMGD